MHTQLKKCVHILQSFIRLYNDLRFIENTEYKIMYLSTLFKHSFLLQQEVMPMGIQI